MKSKSIPSKDLKIFIISDKQCLKDALKKIDSNHLGFLLTCDAKNAINHMLSKTRESLRDSKKRSMIETVTDVAIGFVMYLPINFLILPLFAEQISSYDILGFFQLSAIFTAIALVRKYTIRRWFENLKQIKF